MIIWLLILNSSETWTGHTFARHSRYTCDCVCGYFFSKLFKSTYTETYTIVVVSMINNFIYINSCDQRKVRSSMNLIKSPSSRTRSKLNMFALHSALHTCLNSVLQVPHTWNLFSFFFSFNVTTKFEYALELALHCCYCRFQEGTDRSKYRFGRLNKYALNNEFKLKNR